MTEVLRQGEAARVAEADEGLSLDELRLAARNHGMPLEALRFDLTPPGLHYLLAHYDIPFLDPAAWRLSIGGHVRRPLSLSLNDLQARPVVSRTVTMECAGNGRARLLPRPVSQPWLDEAVGTARWTGCSLSSLLAAAGVRDGAVDVAFTGHDHGTERGVEQDYTRALSVADVSADVSVDDVLLAYEMNGAPVPPQHGAPVRLIVPGWYGMAHVKWLRTVTVLDSPFTGYQNEVAYRVRSSVDDPGEPVTRIRPRALVVPPGFPDFMTRRRVVDAGPVALFGRAWSGRAPVSGVEYSVDDGATWTPGTLGPEVSRYAWRAWSHTWQAVSGEYTLCVRATDADGAQPVDQPWNLHGMANNMAQRVPVTVR